MNKDSAQKRLIELGLYPLKNVAWNSFNVTLCSNSKQNEYLQVLKVIRDNVAEDLGGVFIIELEDEILFIGSSKDNLRYRIIRQMEKIYTRDDKRADFFKKEENQGNLTIYFSSEDGESNKKLLKCVLQPKYDKSLLEGNHRPTSRSFWESYFELSCNLLSSDILEVNVGADDPMLFELPEALKFASKVAKRKKFNSLLEIEDGIRVYGQNNLVERKFFFKR